MGSVNGSNGANGPDKLSNLFKRIVPDTAVGKSLTGKPAAIESPYRKSYDGFFSKDDANVGRTLAAAKDASVAIGDALPVLGGLLSQSTRQGPKERNFNQVA